MGLTLSSRARAHASRIEKLRLIVQRLLFWLAVLESARATLFAELTRLSNPDAPDDRVSAQEQDRRTERRRWLTAAIRAIDVGGDRWDRGFLKSLAVEHGMLPPPGSADVLDGLFGLHVTRSQIASMEAEIAKLDARVGADA